MTLRLALLGDSIAYGQGASRPADRPAERLQRGLAERGVQVETEVVAVSGARSVDLAAQVRRLARRPPDVALVIVGANDLTHLVPAEEAAEALGAAVAVLRGTGAEIVVAPAPDLSAVPHVPPALRPTVRAASERLRQLQVAAVRQHGARIADADHATSSSFADDLSLFAADLFHPSSAGYAVIAEAILPTLLEAVRAVGAGQT
jgi:lysophospholipase L1-like esterase